MNIMKSNIMSSFVLILLITSFTGCTSYHRTTSTTTQTATASPADNTEVSTETTKQTSAVKTETTTETTPQKHGVIGGLFYFIGEVIAFPFKVIGGILDAIF